MNNNWYPPNPYHRPNWQNNQGHQGFQGNQGWDNNWNQSQMPPSYRRITIDEAMAIALEQVPGQVVKVELDTEKGMQVYEVDVVTAQGVKYEVAVDINTGGIVEIEVD